MATRRLTRARKFRTSVAKFRFDAASRESAVTRRLLGPQLWAMVAAKVGLTRFPAPPTN